MTTGTTHEPLLRDATLVSRGKVREMYEAYPQPDEMELHEADVGRLWMVATDHISTYDCVHETDIPDKGKVLTGLSVFWFDKTKHICPNHLISWKNVPPAVRGRALLIERLEMIQIECVVRGYLAGSAWAEYASTGKVCGVVLPAGLSDGSKLPEPIFTPATKAHTGEHDENISIGAAGELIGDPRLVEELGSLSRALYSFAAEYAFARGIIVADTKFEFGRDSRGQVKLADEVLTPDSSRFWPVDQYQPGHAQPSFDKQFVRDWATSTGWDKTPPGPELPDDVVMGTRARYVEAYERITEQPFEEWLELNSPLSTA